MWPGLLSEAMVLDVCGRCCLQGPCSSLWPSHQNPWGCPQSVLLPEGMLTSMAHTVARNHVEVHELLTIKGKIVSAVVSVTEDSRLSM